MSASLSATGLPAAAASPSRSSADDVALLAAVATGDAAALGLLYDQYDRQVFGLALHILHSTATAEEVTQETFLAVWRRAALYQASRGTVRGCLFSTAQHRAIDVLRRQQARPNTVPWPDQEYLAGSSDTWAAVSDSLTAQELRAAVATLATRERESIELAYFGGLRYPEIAEHLDIPLGTVKSRLRRGFEQVRQALTHGQVQAAAE